MAAPWTFLSVSLRSHSIAPIRQSVVVIQHPFFPVKVPLQHHASRWMYLLPRLEGHRALQSAITRGSEVDARSTSQRTVGAKTTRARSSREPLSRERQEMGLIETVVHRVWHVCKLGPPTLVADGGEDDRSFSAGAAHVWKGKKGEREEIPSMTLNTCDQAQAGC